MRPGERPQRLLRHFVAFVAALAVAGVGGVFAASDGTPTGPLAAVAVVAGLGAVTFLFPLVRTGTAGARTYHLVETPLVAGLLLLDPRRAMLAFVCGIAVGWLVTRKSAIKLVFGVAEHAVAASAAVLLVEATAALSVPGPSEAHIAIGMLGYFAVNHVLNSTVFVLAGVRRPGEPFFVDFKSSIAVATVSIVIGAVVGFIGRGGSGYTVLATIPIAMVFLLSRAHANSARSVELLQGIVAAVADTHAGMSTADVEAAVCTRVEQLLDSPKAELRSTPPGEGEIGAVVEAGGASQWLIATPRPVEAFRAEEADLLRALAGVATRALENASLQEQLARQALHDPLTGAPNRRLLVSELAAALARATRTGDRVGVAFLDLTEFKSVNDQLGHDAGDDLLRAVTDRLTASVRAGDVVGRIGGDEFVLVFPTIDDGAAPNVTQRVLAAFDRPFAAGGTLVAVHCNVGVAVSPDDGVTPGELLRRADAAMYAAKRLGGNTVAYAGGVPMAMRVPAVEVAPS